MKHRIYSRALSALVFAQIVLPPRAQLVTDGATNSVSGTKAITSLAGVLLQNSHNLMAT